MTRIRTRLVVVLLALALLAPSAWATPAAAPSVGDRLIAAMTEVVTWLSSLLEDDEQPAGGEEGTRMGPGVPPFG